MMEMAREARLMETELSVHEIGCPQTWNCLVVHSPERPCDHRRECTCNMKARLERRLEFVCAEIESLEGVLRGKEAARRDPAGPAGVQR